MYWQLHAYHRKILDAELSFLPEGGEKTLRIILAYPNSYGVGIANLGYQVALYMFQKTGRALVDRVFYPSKEERYFIGKSGSPLSSWKYDIPLREADLLAFSISFEMDYFKFLRMLEWADIPIKRVERREDGPLVAVGGAVTFFNPFPLSMFVDFFIVGEAEEIISSVVDVIYKKRRAGRKAVLDELSRLEGVYVPGISERVRRLKARKIDKNISFSPVISPYSGWGKILLIEITRGCVFNCGFCVVSSCYAPYRFRNFGIIESVMHSMAGKVERVGFVSAVPMLHPQIDELSKDALDMGFKVSYSSVRIDLLREEMVKALVSSGYRSITFAPETGRDELRFSINKRFTNELILDKLRMSYEIGIRHFKMYFVVGLPGETRDDIYGIYELSSAVIEQFRGGVSLTVSVSAFVPKPFSPFEGKPFAGVEEINERQNYLRRLFRGEKHVKLVMDTPQSAAVQTLFSRGTEDMGKVLFSAYRSGGYRVVLKSCREHGIDIESIFNGTSERVWHRITQ